MARVVERPNRIRTVHIPLYDPPEPGVSVPTGGRAT